MPLDDTDMFILDTLDDLAAEAEENEDAPGRRGNIPLNLSLNPNLNPKWRLTRWKWTSRNTRPSSCGR